MESLPESAELIALPLVISVPSYLRDHCVGDHVILPAVEALQIVARSRPEGKEDHCLRQEQALFHHPLVIDPSATEIAMVHEHARYADGRCLSRLTTLRAGRQMKVSRRMEHLSVWFVPADRQAGCGAVWEAGREMGERAGNQADLSQEPSRARGVPSECEGKRVPKSPFPPSDEWPLPRAWATDFPVDPADVAANAEGPFRVSADRLYDELVPFGPAYRNLRGDVLLTESSVSATVCGGHFPEALGPLGSPFPLDAAMHAACAWGQRYRNRVVFPVGFDGREILAPTRAGERYFCRITPLPDEGAVLRFDIRLRDRKGRPVERISGLRMRDISGGKWIPPAWVREGV